ncbi:MAG: acyl-CoA dehydrogenase, partial [Candidatus Dadabacteria bacterium]
METNSNCEIPLETAKFAKSLFLGNILENVIYPFPSIKEPEAETLELVLNSVKKFLEDHTDKFSEYDREGTFPDSYIEGLKELGLFSLIIPEDFGGLGLSNLAYSRVFQETSYFDASTSVTLGAHSSIGMKGLLLFGSEEQKAKYLPKLATGEMIAAFCLTEPGAGSDAASIKTTASKQSDGSWILNGSKLWISNGSLADFFTVFARTDSGEKGKISAFIVERGYPGVSIGPKEDKMGIRASATTAVDFNDVRLPPEALLGEEGKGFKVAMSILNNGRTGLGGGCVGGIKRCIALAVRQASDRKQFGRPISEFMLIKGKIAQMTVDCFATESMVSTVASMMDRGVLDYSVEAAMSKVFASEAMWHAANEALQIAGGNGFMKEYPYERILRDSRINLIFEGTNEILRLYIALSGLKTAGNYLKEVTKGMINVFNDPIKGFGVFSDYAVRKLSHLTPLGRDRLEFVPQPLRQEAEIFENYTVEFAKTVEWVLRTYRERVVGSQLLSKRIADVAIDLFAGLCTLSRVSTLIEKRGEEN